MYRLCMRSAYNVDVLAIIMNVTSSESTRRTEIEVDLKLFNTIEYIDTENVIKAKTFCSHTLI